MKMEKKELQHPTGEKGFTLLEILVVLTIMGFLIAMVAPRLGGVSSSAVDTVCDTNQNRMVTYIGAYFEKSNKFPSLLTNLVDEIAAGEFQIPAVSDDEPDNGPEALAAEFNERNHLFIHYLSVREVKQLKKMGIAAFYNLNDYSAYNDAGDAYKAGYPATDAIATTLGVDNPNDYDLDLPITKAPAMEKFILSTMDADTNDYPDTPIAVAMIATGVETPTGNFTLPPVERNWGEIEYFGRIVLGMGAESGLIKDGLIGNAAHCPGGIQDAANVIYNDYNLVLPRLDETAALMEDATVGAALLPIDGDTVTNGIQAYAVGYGEDNEPGATYDYVANGDNYRVRAFNISEAQEAWQFGTMCPEGHMYPADDEDYWGVDLNPTAGANGPTAGTIDE